MPDTPPPTRTFRTVMAVCSPIVRWWGRAQVTGLEHLPASGPVILVGNHDSYWDPIAVGLVAVRRRMIQALAKSELWTVKGLGPILDRMGQIPIVRGSNDTAAYAAAIAALREGRCIGIFPEGTRSKGRELRARSGVGRLVRDVPEAEVVCVAIRGTVDIPRFPRRPKVELDFFRPAGGGIGDHETPGEFSARLVRELRERAPQVPHGRKPQRG